MAGATSINPAQVTAMFKKVYGDEFLKITDVEDTAQQTISFDTEDEPGESFDQAIRMTNEQGFSFRAAGSAATQMNPAIAMKVEKATILGGIIDFRSRIDIEVMARAVTSKQAFKDHVGVRMEGMRDALKFHLEWTILQGGRDCGVISAIAAGGGGAQKVITFTDASWCGAFWSNAENMPFDVYDPTLATKRNTQAITVDSVDLDNKKVTLTGAEGAGAWATVAVNDVFYRLGSKGVEAPGILKLVANQTGVINNIDSSAYGLWRGVTKAVAGQLSFATVLQQDAKTAERGGKKASKKLWVSPRNFAVLNSDLSANRRYDGSYNRTKGDNGFGAIEYYSPTGVIQVEVHLFMKDGEALLFNPKKFSRKGPSDVTFNIKGAPNGQEMFLLVPDFQQYEYRGYSHQGVLCTAPAQNALMTGLVVPA